MNKESSIREIARNKFSEYLVANNHRRTPERFAILDIIYAEDRHFDMDALYNAMNESNFRVSRATLYNTMQLLVKCKLVVQHQFGRNLSFYEKAYGNDSHLHLICTLCGKVKEDKDPVIQDHLTKRKTRGFYASHYTLYIYGVCTLCRNEAKRRERELKNQQKLNNTSGGKR